MHIFKLKNILILFFAISSLNISALTLQEAVLSEKNPETPSLITSSSDGESFYQMTDESRIDKIDYKTGKVITPIFDASTARNCTIKKWDGYVLSPDESKILLFTNKRMIYRHSFSADYYVFEIKRNNLKPLSENGAQQIATFSSDGRMVAFVRNNNIYIKKLDYGTEVAVTTDGVKNKIINGLPDWGYEEEFGMTNSLNFSNDNLMLSFLRWDESEVPTYSFPIYEGACNPMKEYSLYPGIYSYKYPVAGGNNSKVSVLNYDVETRKLNSVNIPMSGDYYIPQIKFSPSDQLMVMALNRNQNKFQLFSANPRSTVAKSIYIDESTSWINIDKIIKMTHFYSKSFVIPSEKSGFNHLYEYSNAGSLIRQLTKGDWDVTKYYGYDAVANTYVFQSTQAGPLDRIISKVDAKGAITPLENKAGTNDAQYNSTLSYYIYSFSSASKPNEYILCNRQGKNIREMEMNREYAEKFNSNYVPNKEFFTCRSGDVTLNGYMIKPLDFNPNKKYPVIISQYSGPGSQEVLNKWHLDWEQYAATQGYIVACVDGRGTGGRGKEWESKVYMQLGKYETIDQLAGVSYLVSLPYVDSNKIGIFGWSYGGYETLMAMSNDKTPFAAGVAVAPVTNWKFYDSIYTERYMRTPNENDNGYFNSAPINFVNNQKGALLIIAGTADDNVHIANTYQYAAQMTSNEKLIDMMIYPNMNHSINGCDVRYILYKKITSFFDSKLK